MNGETLGLRSQGTRDTGPHTCGFASAVTREGPSLSIHSPEEYISVITTQFKSGEERGIHLCDDCKSMTISRDATPTNPVAYYVLAFLFCWFVLKFF